ncbi:MAG: cbb3-type cytochrome oxidase assembly protein CcoS [Sandaracinaceae bacterium]|nr:cbb3-type cytochrome oxidase assembly protein CcoS [Sandaracinaceae bacterium]MDW8246125.1 cbb3-type cytochrome oxidase assembly protein CcoS [Sandaracinaceae bacterium]
MSVLILTIFVSIVLAAFGMVLFAWSTRIGTFDHLDRLSILPLEDDNKEKSRGKKIEVDYDGNGNC